MSFVTRPVSEIERCCYPGCRAEVYQHPAAPPFCGNHLVECAAFIADQMGIFLLDNRPGVEDALSARDRLAEQRTGTSSVYYLRIGDRVKIGTSRDVRARVAALAAALPSGEVELLTTEPGGYDVETTRHREFAAERVDPRRELFNPSPRLLAHIETLRTAAA